MTEVTIQRIVNEEPDSIELGSPSKNIKKKIYGNANDVEGFKKKIDNMAEVEKYAQAKLAVNI